MLDLILKFVLNLQIVDNSTENLVAVLEESESENNANTNQTENADTKTKKDLENFTEIVEQNLVEESTDCPPSKRPKLSNPLTILTESVATESSRPNQSRPKEFQKSK